MGCMVNMMLGSEDVKMISRSSYAVFGKEINKYDEIGPVLCYKFPQSLAEVQKKEQAVIQVWREGRGWRVRGKGFM